MSTTFNESVLVTTTGSAGDQLELNSTTGAGGGVSFRNDTAAAGKVASSGAIKENTDSDLMIAAATGKKLLLSAGGATTEQVVVDTSGSVGIGTPNPAATLDVAGTLSVSDTTTLGDVTINDTLTINDAVVHITSPSAAALTVARSGTNYGLQVDESATSAETGLKIKAAATGNGLALSTISPATNEGLSLDAKGNAAVTVGGVSTGHVLLAMAGGSVGVGTSTPMSTLDVAGSFAVSGTTTLNDAVTINDDLTINNAAVQVTSSSATALTVARAGANYSLQVDDSTVSSETGVRIKSAAAGAGVAMSAISSGTNETLRLDAKGSGAVVIAGTSSGDISLVTAGGNVGVGTASPAATLDVAGTLSVSGASTLNGDVSVNDSLTLNDVVTANANVAINNATLLIASSSVTALGVSRSGTNYGLQIDQSTVSAATGIKMKAAAAGDGVAISAISSGADESVTLDAKGSGAVTVGGISTGSVNLVTGGGKVGVGTSSPSARLDVAGSLAVSGATTLGADLNVAGGAVQITSPSAAALTVARTGSNYSLQVDDSTSSAETGLRIKSAAAGSGIALSAISSGTNEGISLDAKGAGVIAVGGASSGAIALAGGGGNVGIGTGSPASKLDVAGTFAVSGAATLNGAVTVNDPLTLNDVVTANADVALTNATLLVTSSSMTALGVARAGTSYGLQVDESTASAATGIKVKAAAAGDGVAVSAISPNANENVTLDAKGSGAITVGGVSSGAVNLATGGGNVGVGTPSPSAKLDVAGTLAVSGATALGADLAVGSGTVQITSPAATALTVARAGSNYSLQVDDSAEPAETGLKIKPTAAGSGIALSAISPGTNEGLSIDAKGSGAISIGGNASGPVSLANGGGNVGIGTASPAAKLDVAGTFAVSGTATLNSAVTVNDALTLNDVVVANADVALTNATLLVSSSSTMALGVARAGTNYGLQVDESTALAATGIKIKAAAAGDGVAVSAISPNANESVTLDAKGSGVITVGGTSTGTVNLATAGGNVGVGTSSPSAKLDVAGTLAVSGATMLGADVNVAGAVHITSASATALTVARTGSNYSLQVDDSTASSETGLKITPAAAGTGIALSAISSGTNEGLSVDAKGSGTISVGGASSGVVSLGNGGGNVGIGTMSPQARLHVAGESGTEVANNQLVMNYASSNINAPLFSAWRSRGTLASPSAVQNGDFLMGLVGRGYDGSTYRVAGSIVVVADGTIGTNDMPGRMSFSTTADGAFSPTERVRIDSSGRVGIGTTSPSAQLHTTGTVRFASFGAGTATFDASGNLTSSSDITLKEVVGTFDRGLEDLAGLKPIVYKWNERSGCETEGHYAGFSAQNVRDRIPEAVSSRLTLSDRAIVAALVNAVNELHQKVRELEAERAERLAN